MAKNESGFVCKILDTIGKKIVSKIVDYIDYIDFYNSLNIYTINKNSVSLLPMNKDKLYGVSLEHQIHKFNELTVLHSIEGLVDIARSDQEHNDVLLAITKNGLKRGIYVFSRNDSVIKRLAEHFNVNIMSGRQIADAIFEMVHHGSYYVKNNRLIKEGFDTDNDDIEKNLDLAPTSEMIVGTKFAKIFKIAVSNLYRNYIPYQATSFTINNEFDIYRFLKMDWQGTFFLWMNYKAELPITLLKRIYREASVGDNETVAKLKDIVTGDNEDMSDNILSSKYCVANAFLILDKKYKNVISDIRKTTNIEFTENYLTGLKVMSQTPLKYRDIDFDEVIDFETSKKFYKTCIKAPSPKPEFWAYDLTNGFINFSFKEFTNPHSFIGGQTGAGKSVTWLKTLSMILLIDPARKQFKSPVLGKTVKVRYCDVGYTSGSLLKEMMKEHPDDIERISSRPDAIKYNIFDIEFDKYGNPKKEELDFLEAFLDMAIEADSNGEERFTSDERMMFKETYKEFVKDPESLVNFKLEEIERRGYEKECEYFYSQGYSKQDGILDLPKDMKYVDRFRKPTLDNFIQYMTKKMNYPNTSAIDKKTLESLIAKMRIIENYGVFSDFTNIDFSNNKPFYHIDFNELKDNKRLFVVMFWLLFKKWIQQDNKEASKDFSKKKTTIYVIEEAHNFFDIEAFRRLLKTVTKELRKFGGQLVFISQGFQDVPESILSQLAVKMFVYKDKEEAKNEIFQNLSLSNEEKALFDIELNANRQFFIKTTKGTSICHYKIDKEEMQYYLPLVLD